MGEHYHIIHVHKYISYKANFEKSQKQYTLLSWSHKVMDKGVNELFEFNFD